MNRRRSGEPRNGISLLETVCALIIVAGLGTLTVRVAPARLFATLEMEREIAMLATACDRARASAIALRQSVKIDFTRTGSRQVLSYVVETIPPTANDIWQRTVPEGVEMSVSVDEVIFTPTGSTNAGVQAWVVNHTGSVTLVVDPITGIARISES